MKNNIFAIDGIEQPSQNEMIEVEGGEPVSLIIGAFFVGVALGSLVIWIKTTKNQLCLF